LTDNTEAFYWDSDARKIYVCLVNYDEPFIHTIMLGIAYGFSFDEFAPVGSSQFFEGRLLGSPVVSQSRDPLYWGKMQYSVGGLSVINSDGKYDTFAQDNDIYGNEARIKFGYKQLDLSDYVTIHTGTLQSIGVSEEELQINLADKRAQLTKPITYSCTDLNALDAIVEILVASYGVIYNETYFDTAAWAAAQAVAPDITMDMKDPAPSIDVIEEICASTFGLFLIMPDNRYSFKIVDTSTTALTTIVHTDILNRHSITYDPSEVISSVRVGYDKNWDSEYVSPYTFVTDTSVEAAAYLKYKTYNQKTFFTLLTTATAASSFASDILDYAKDVHGTGQITVPMKYYSYNVADIVNAEITRETTPMLGTAMTSITKLEIISKAYNLRDGNITFGYRIV
jgi:predicted transglutaminase-like cysteine proteinase